MSWANDFLISAAAIVELPFSIKVVLSALTECGDKLPSESIVGKDPLNGKHVQIEWLWIRAAADKTTLT